MKSRRLDTCWQCMQMKLGTVPLISIRLQQSNLSDSIIFYCDPRKFLA